MSNNNSFNFHISFRLTAILMVLLLSLQLSAQAASGSTPDGTDADDFRTLYTESIPNPREVIIAVIDTGIDFTHPDLADIMWVNQGEIPGDGIDNDGNGYIDDIYGWDFYNSDNTVCHYDYDEETKCYTSSSIDNDSHGTHVAGIIASSLGKVFNSPQMPYVPIKIMSLKIHGGNGNGTVANAVKAIRYASLMGADICNLSWGSSVYSEALETAIRESDMLFVIAAGNEGIDVDSEFVYPACLDLDNIISVTFVNSEGELTENSNYGLTNVDIAAAGDNIYSTVVGSHSHLSGSSMAAPYVTAMAAVIYSYSDGLYPSNVRNVLLSSVKLLPSLLGRCSTAGVPYLPFILANLSLLKSDTSAPVLSIKPVYKSDYVSLILSASDDTSGVRMISYMNGYRMLSSFKHGIAGTAVRSDTLSLARFGQYTFYISDYSGNEAIFYYNLAADTTAPSIEYSFIFSPSGSECIAQVICSDTQSGTRLIQWIENDKTLTDYLADGEIHYVRMSANETIEVYVEDIVGNSASYVLKPSFSQTGGVNNPPVLSMHVDETYILNPYTASNDIYTGIHFVSSDTSVIYVDRWGGLLALAPGSATVTAFTSDGILSQCIITVE